MLDHTDLFIVGLNITKHEAHRAHLKKEIIRVAQGAFFLAGKNVEQLFNQFGIRLTKYLFPRAVLTHSTAWYKRPAKKRIFIGGEYPYKKELFKPYKKLLSEQDSSADAYEYYDEDFCIIQSAVHPNLEQHIRDSRMYELVRFEDPLGPKHAFEMLCATPEMTMLQLMESIKVNWEKDLPKAEKNKLFTLLLNKYQRKTAVLEKLEEIAIVAKKENDFARFLETQLHTLR